MALLPVGEEQPGENAIGRSEQRSRHGLSGVDVGGRPVPVVYEPTWAIGTDEAAESEARRPPGYDTSPPR